MMHYIAGRLAHCSAHTGAKVKRVGGGRQDASSSMKISVSDIKTITEHVICTCLSYWRLETGMVNGPLAVRSETSDMSVMRLLLAVVASAPPLSHSSVVRLLLYPRIPYML